VPSGRGLCLLVYGLDDLSAVPAVPVIRHYMLTAEYCKQSIVYCLYMKYTINGMVRYTYLKLRQIVPYKIYIPFQVNTYNLSLLKLYYTKHSSSEQTTVCLSSSVG